MAIKGEFPCRLLTHQILGNNESELFTVLKHEPQSNHILVVHQNVKGCEHMQLDFHAPTKESLTYKCWSPKVLKTGSKKRGEVLTQRRRLVDEPGFEKMGVDSWQLGTCKPYPTIFPLHLGKFVLYYTKIWWVSGLHKNSP